MLFSLLEFRYVALILAVSPVTYTWILLLVLLRIVATEYCVVTIQDSVRIGGFEGHPRIVTIKTISLIWGFVNISFIA